jgi:small GTP-binding protein
MVQKKVALLGAPGVGKTSLVRQFVESRFDDKYLTTIGVKVDRKPMRVNEQDLSLMLWDVAGAEEHFSVPSSYVRGSSGYLLVADGTRPGTLDVGIEIVDQMRRDLGPLPYVLVLNKHDLVAEWQIQEAALAGGPWACPIVRASARTGEGVESAFMALAQAILG